MPAGWGTAAQNANSQILDIHTNVARGSLCRPRDSGCGAGSRTVNSGALSLPWEKAANRWRLQVKPTRLHLSQGTVGEGGK